MFHACGSTAPFYACTHTACVVVMQRSFLLMLSQTARQLGFMLNYQRLAKLVKLRALRFLC